MGSRVRKYRRYCSYYQDASIPVPRSTKWRQSAKKHCQVNLDRIALQFALINVNPRRLYRLKMVLDFGSLFLTERRPASFDNAAPNTPNRAAEPAVTLASSRALDCSVDVTDKSKAAGLPRSQLGTRTSAGRILPHNLFPDVDPSKRVGRSHKTHP
ncbi:hypothetical protein EMCRGX_G005652 [Ephydatia muelleri]